LCPVRWSNEPRDRNRRAGLALGLTRFGSPTSSPSARSPVGSLGRPDDDATADLALQAGGTQFDITGLDAPSTADPGQPIDVTATVENVGELGNTQTVEFVFDGAVAATATGVELAPGTGTTVEFTDVPLPGEGGVFEHGVQSANASQTAEMQIGSPEIEPVELSQPAELTLEQEISLLNNGTAPYEGVLKRMTNLDDTLPNVGAPPLNRTTLRLAPGDNVETGYQRSQHLGLDAPRDPAVAAVYSETIAIVSSSPPN
jgi:hypothetical protein